MQTISSEPARRRRVPAMAPDDRRAALIEATIPLLREHGVLVTTRQIAEAAGVAEGTIFGVFPDKPSLIRAAVLSALDPQPMVRTISAVDPEGSLRTRLIDVAGILQRRFAENGKLMGVIRSSAKADDDPAELHHAMMQAQCRVIEAIAHVIGPDRRVLRLSPAAVGRLLVTLIFAAGHHAFGADDGEPLDSTELVALMLDGLLTPEPAATPSAPNTGEPA